MSVFTPIVEAQLSGQSPRFELLAEARFTSGTMRMWTGPGRRTFGGEAYDGFGALLSVEGIQAAIDGTAPQVTITTAATDQLVSIALAQFKTEAKGKRLSLAIQFFNEFDETPLGPPWRIWSGLMERASYSAEPDGDHRLAFAVESLASLRARPRNIMLSNAEQQRRFPGDRGLEFVAGIRKKEITWPNF